MLKIVCVAENELGETALDVSRRLKHRDCEELVRSIINHVYVR